MITLCLSVVLTFFSSVKHSSKTFVYYKATWEKKFSQLVLSLFNLYKFLPLPKYSIVHDSKIFQPVFYYELFCSKFQFNSEF